MAKKVVNGGLDIGSIFGSAIETVLKTTAEAKTGAGAAAYTGLIEDVKRAQTSGDSNAVVKLGLTLLGVYAAGVIADNVVSKKGLKDGSE